MSSLSLAASRLDRGCPVGPWLLAAGSTVCAAPEARTASVGSTVSLEHRDSLSQITTSPVSFDRTIDEPTISPMTELRIPTYIRSPHMHALHACVHT